MFLNKEFKYQCFKRTPDVNITLELLKKLRESPFFL